MVAHHLLLCSFNGFIVRFVSVVTHFITARKDICRWFLAEMVVPWHMGHRIRDLSVSYGISHIHVGHN
jgi:hypothetical protein